MTLTERTPLPRSFVVDALAGLRQEWQEAVDGNNLVDIRASVGLLLADVVMSIGLDTVEQLQVFGADLTHELGDTLAPPSSSKRE